jgi:hypothetical protein
MREYRLQDILKFFDSAFEFFTHVLSSPAKQKKSMFDCGERAYNTPFPQALHMRDTGQNSANLVWCTV